MFETLRLLYLWGKHQALIYTLGIVGLIYYWDPLYLWLLFPGFIFCGVIGLEIAQHRYFCHGSFTAKPGVYWFLLFASMFSVGGGPLYWSALHRTHHKTADTDADPHRPHDQPILSFLHCNDRSRSEVNYRNVQDLVHKPGMIFLAENYAKVYFGTLFLIALIDVKFCLYFLILPGIITLWTTGIVNVLGHRGVGYRNFDTPDTSRNSKILNLITFGGGNHHNHHHRPWSYTTKVHWYEHDLSGWIIKTFLAKEVKT